MYVYFYKHVCIADKTSNKQKSEKHGETTKFCQKYRKEGLLILGFGGILLITIFIFL